MEKTSYLGLALPHRKHVPVEDIERIRCALEVLDNAAKKQAEKSTSLEANKVNRIEFSKEVSELIKTYTEHKELSLLKGAHGFSAGFEGQTLVMRDGKMVWEWIDRYEIGEFYYFRHPKLKTGFQVAYGGLIQNAKKVFPTAWEYLQSNEGKLLCVTETDWQAMTRQTFATLADGTKVGWDGVGGAPFYVVNAEAGTLRLPDLRGMYIEAAGFDGLDVGGVHGDAVRNITGEFGADDIDHPGYRSGHELTGAFKGLRRWSYDAISGDGKGGNGLVVGFDASLVVPTANKNQPRAWGALPCVYLGHPK